MRRDKRNYINKMADQAEEAAKRNNWKEVYNTTRKITDRKFRKTTHIKDKEGRTLTTIEEQLDRWAEYFNVI